MYDGMLNNIIAYYGLLIAIMLPIVVLLIGDMKNSPKIDKQVVFRKILPTKYFGILLGVFLLPLIQFLLFYSDFLGNIYCRVIVIILTIIMTNSVFYVITGLVTWILSGENKEAFHGFYRQNLRLKYLNKGSTKKRSEKWHQFWLDESVVEYFGNDICSYIDSFFTFLYGIKEKEEWKYAKKSCFAFYYNISALYEVGKEEINIKAYDRKSLALELIDTIPYCICGDIVDDIYNVKTDNDGTFVWCGVMASLLLKEMERDDNLGEGEWLTAFNMSFFGIKKSKEQALAVILVMIKHYCRDNETQRSIKEKIDKLRNASCKVYKQYYHQLYKELFNFDPNNSKLLKMVEEGVENE